MSSLQPLLALAIALIAIPGASAFATADKASGTSAPLTAEQLTKARNLFNNWNCGGCHILTDAEGYGDGGQSFDGNTHLDHEFIVDRITNGLQAMPSFRDHISDEDIDLLARYILQVKK